MTPNALLRLFFQQSFEKLLCIDWRRLPERADDALMDAIDELPKDVQHKIETTLARVYEVASKAGIQSMREVAKQMGLEKFAAQLPRANAYYVAMWAWLNYPEIFEQASIIQSVENLTRWRKRKDLPRVEPRRTEESLEELARELSQFLRREEGRGGRCTVEHFRRCNGTDFYVAYPDDFLQSVIIHDETGNLSPHAFRQTFEIVFAYSQHEGTLELYAKVETSTKAKLEALFGRLILGTEVESRGRQRPYDLDRLKDRQFTLETDPADGVTAAIAVLQLRSTRIGSIQLEPPRDGTTRDFYDMATTYLNRDTVSWDEVNIQKATFRLQFGSQNGQRAETLEFEVTFPDYCSVRSRRPERVDLVQKYLKRWGITHAA